MFPSPRSVRLGGATPFAALLSSSDIITVLAWLSASQRRRPARHHLGPTLRVDPSALALLPRPEIPQHTRTTPAGGLPFFPSTHLVPGSRRAAGRSCFATLLLCLTRFRARACVYESRSSSGDFRGPNTSPRCMVRIRNAHHHRQHILISSSPPSTAMALIQARDRHDSRSVRGRCHQAPRRLRIQRARVSP